MVLPVSGFLPVPLPMMIPFMGAQSLVIGKMFGEGFQYGKRKISAMPNEEFNKLSFEDLMSNARNEIKASIPTMQQAMNDMQPMVATVVHEFIDYLKLVLEAAKQELPSTGQDLQRETTGLSFGLVGLAAEIAKRSGLSLADVQRLIEQSIPGLPSAEAHIGANIALTQPSTIKGLTVAQAQFQARQKQKEFERQQELKRREAQTLANQIRRQGGPPTGPTKGVSGRGSSNISCQSLRIERSRLINTIGNITNLVRRKPAHLRGGDIANLKRVQQQMVDFLARHRTRLKECGM